MIHTILPYEAIFLKETQPAAAAREYPIPHGHLCVLETSGRATVSALFSTDPYDYLNPQYQPGSPWKA